MNKAPKNYIDAVRQIWKLKVKCWLYFLLGIIIGASAVLVYFMRIAGQ